MPRTVVCDQCSREIDVPGGGADSHVRCEHCQSWIAVPDEPDETEREKAEPVSPGRRKRRRRRPKARPVWPILLLISLVLFGLCGGSAGLFLWVGRPQWRQYDSPGGGFSVELPAAPNKDMKRHAGVRDAELMQAEGTILFARLEDYVVVYSEIDPAMLATKSDDEILQDAVDGMLADKAGTKLLHDKRVDVSGLPGREIGVSIPGDGEVLSRLVIAGTRLYVVAAGGRFSHYTDPRLRRYVDSFRIAGPVNRGNRWK